MSATATMVCWACGAPGLRPATLPLVPPSLRCEACGMTRVADTDTYAVRELYDDAYFERYGGLGVGYDADPRARMYEARRRLGFVRRRVRAGQLLEVGSAAGYFLDAARRAGFAVTGIEPAAELARGAHERFGVDVRTGFVEDAELEPASADTVCGWHVLEHIPDPLGVLRELRKVLKPGGLLALEVPNAGSVEAERLGAAWPHWQPVHHVGHYTPIALRKLIERAGYEVLHVETLSGVAYYPPRRAMQPRVLFDSAVLGIRLRALPWRPHPTRHELLRIAARA